MSGLMRYDAACRALAEAKAVDEVKDIRDKSVAMAAYARQAKNKQLEVDAAEIRFRSERRLGEMLAAQKANGGMANGGDAMRARSRTVTELPPTLADMGIDKNLSSRAQKLAEVPDDVFEQTMAEHRDEQCAVTASTISKLSKHAVHFSSDSVEHYTPEHIIESVMATMGDIDLDPCADPDHRVPAKAHFTREDDGLARSWHGRVYMNPPYGDAISQWVQKLRDELGARRVEEGIALVPARTDTGWWHLLADFPVCFIKGRLKFIGNDNPAPFPSAVVYVAPRQFWPVFVDEWSSRGAVYEPCGSVL